MNKKYTVHWICLFLITMTRLAAFAQSGATLDDDSGSSPDNWLPVTHHGSYSNVFLVYQDPLFDFVLDGKGAGQLFLKDNQGNVIRPAIRLGGFAMVYTKQSGKKMISRNPVSVSDANLKPVVNNSPRVQFSGVAEDDVKFSRSYEFGRGEIKAQFHFDEPKGIAPPTLGRTSVQFVKQNLKGSIEQHEAMLSAWKATIQAESGRKEYNYWQSVGPLGVDISKITVEGPWGTRVLTIDFTPMDAMGVKYAGNPLYLGYGFMASAGGKGKYAGNRVGIRVTVK